MIQPATIRTHGLLALALVLLLSDATDAAIIRLRKSTTVNSSIIRLADVADVLDTDSRTVEQLEQVVLAPSPVPGKPLRLEFHTVRIRLQALGINLANIEFSGSSVVAVTSLKSTTTSEPERHGFLNRLPKVADWQRKRATELVTKAIEQHLKRISPELAHATVEIHVPENDVLKVLKGAVSGFRIQGGGAPWNAPQTFHVAFLITKEQVYRTQVAGRILLQPRILAVKHTVPRGHVLKAADLVWRQADTAGQHFTRLDEVIHKETTRSIRKNAPVEATDIRAIPLVRSNDIVTVYARYGGIAVKRPLKARSDGALGETVTLVTLDGRDKVLARVIGFHEAETLGIDNATTGSTRESTGKIQFRPASRSRSNLRPTRRGTLGN